MPYGVKPKPKWHPPMLAPEEPPFTLPDMLKNAFPLETDAEMLVKTALGEARGEGEEGMRAVMHAVVNRQSAVPGASIADIVLAPKQFTAWSPGNPNREFMESVKLEEYESLIDMAENVISRGDSDPTGGSTHYYAPGKAEMPGWAGKMEEKATIGGHTFYKEKKKHRRS